jgi:hypothetical protein
MKILLNLTSDSCISRFPLIEKSLYLADNLIF